MKGVGETEKGVAAKRRRSRKREFDREICHLHEQEALKEGNEDVIWMDPQLGALFFGMGWGWEATDWGALSGLENLLCGFPRAALRFALGWYRMAL
jgi:hypothetical protein